MTFQLTILDPEACRRIDPALGASAAAPRVYRYDHAPEPWRLSIGTFGVPRSHALSLGGFRIAEALRTGQPGYDNDREALELARGMEEKIHWSRLIGAGGPRLLGGLVPLVGGKCVLLPSPDARIGMPRDAAILDFAAAALNDFGRRAGINVVTGQDLGHGTMSDGRTPSLRYLHDRFAGSVLADTGRPTAEGNYYLLRGMLSAAGIALRDARVGLVGAGNIGRHVLSRLRADGARVSVCEVKPETRARLAAEGVAVVAADEKATFVRQPFDALVVNAGGATLDPDTVQTVADNATIRVICGCENLVMPDPGGVEIFQRAHKLYAPTEFGGMMGYLTAVEEYLCRRAGAPFDIAVMMRAAERLEQAGRAAAEYTLLRHFAISFEQGVREKFGS
jgi:hypothetical protein